VAPLYQDQLILVVGLDIGGYGPNNLRALKIAIKRKLGLEFQGLGNGPDRLYGFKDESQREDVLLMLEDPRYKDIVVVLGKELRAHRRRSM